MNKVIYYYTGTGNSLAVARGLAEELQDNVELIPLAKLAHEKSIKVDCDLVGIVYPVWLHHLPPTVEEFVKKLILHDSYFFGVCTYAVNPYNSLFDLNTLLEQRGKILAAGFTIAMPGKYVLLKDVTFSDEENEKRFSNAKEKIKEIAKILKARERIGIEGHFDENEHGELINYHKNVYQVPEKFRVTAKCNLCGLCIKVCPRDNMELVNGQLTWKTNCDYCLACLHWCPQAAIENGDISPNCRRYHHPDISMTDMMEQR